MSAVSEWVVREYFESMGYLVCQPRKYTVPGRQKKAEEEVDLVVSNPGIRSHEVPEQIVWSTSELGTVARAVVAVRGWHTERFSVSRFEQAPDILRFLEPASIRYAGKLLGADSMARVLCLPRLPASGELKDRTVRVLRERGVDGVISFRTMLLDLVARVQTNRNYEKSDLLQIIRLLKNYELIQEPQLEFFGRRKRSRSSKS